MMRYLIALLTLDFLCWAGLALVFADTLHKQGGVHASYYFYLPLKVAAVALGTSFVLFLLRRIGWLRPLVGTLGFLFGMAALFALPVFLMFAGGGM